MIFIAAGASLFAQSLTVQGVVVSAEDNLPLPGVSVAQKGVAKGTVTDLDGQYLLEVPQNAVLRFSMIGMKTQEVAVNGKTVMNISLQSDEKLLDEVVVTGYSKERKKDLTGAVSVVKIKDIENIPAGNVMSALQGRVPGVDVSTTGQPGGTETGMLIRGITTVNNSTPLYVIDGVQTRENIATLLNANDVESIQILKDAASAAIYGVEAANGVIIITTRQAGKQKTRINFDMSLSSQHFRNNIKMMNAQQWGDAYWKACGNDGRAAAHPQYGSGETAVIPEFIDAAQTIPAGDTDWAKEVYQTAFLQNYNLSVASGTDKASTLFSLNWFDQNGLIKYTDFQRFNIRLNATYRLLNDHIRIGENVNISKWAEIFKPGGIEELTIAQHPLIPVYDVNGGYAGPTTGLGDKPNPVRLLNQQKDAYSDQWRIFGNAFLEIEPVKNLVLRSSFGLDFHANMGSSFEPKWQEGTRTVDKNKLNASAGQYRNWVWSNTAAYSVELGRNTVSALAGMEAKEESGRNIWGAREDYLIEDIDYRYLDAGTGKQLNGGGGYRNTALSYFGKINYSFADRYLFSATLRNDATSRFVKYSSATFPGFTAGWRISEENFMENVKFIDELKLRGSWGKNGNDRLDDNAAYTRYAMDLISAGYDISGINRGIIPAGAIKIKTGNPDIHWEVTTQSNFGIDLEALNHRLNFSFDYFLKNTDGMLIEKPYIAIKGEGGYMAFNAAALETKGFEGAITWRDRIGKDFRYEIAFTGTHSLTIVTDVPEEIYYTAYGGNGIDKSIVGHPLGSWMGYKTRGLYRTDDDLNDGVNQPGKGLGRIRYVDAYPDGVIDDKDRTWLGHSQPKFIGGLNLSIAYKNFDCALFFNGMVRDAWNDSKFYTDFFQLWTGNHAEKLLTDAWNPDENFNSNIPALTAENINDEGRGSDYFIEDGSYIKLKNLQIGYTLPENVLKKLKMERIRLYVQAQDLFTLTKYKGQDPEALGYPYPLPRMFTLGLSVGF
jgi:TonB-linked SusC/RagA family outer membrane protein